MTDRGGVPGPLNLGKGEGLWIFGLHRGTNGLAEDLRSETFFLLKLFSAIFFQFFSSFFFWWQQADFERRSVPKCHENQWFD